MPQNTSTVTPTVFEIPSYNKDKFAAKVDAANRRLAKEGIPGFSVDYDEFTKPKGPGSNVLVPWVRATFTTPLTISLGGYVFVAALVPEDAGMTVHTAPGQDLKGYAPRGDRDCDHCHTKRRRTRLYLVRNPDGGIIQLGHSCIEVYTGMSPKGLWALTFEDELRTFCHVDDADRGGWEGYYRVSVDTVIAYAYAYSNKGRGYVPTSGSDGMTTVQEVRSAIFSGGSHARTESEKEYIREKAAEAAEYQNDSALIPAIKESANSLGSDSDYGRNMRVILGGDYVSDRNLGILSSLVAVYARQQAKKEAEKAKPRASSGFLGEVGEMLRNFGVTPSVVRYNEGYYGTTTFIVGTSDDGHTVLWSASKAVDVEPGERFEISSARVKKHGNYNGVDQTELINCRLKQT